LLLSGPVFGLACYFLSRCSTSRTTIAVTNTAMTVETQWAATVTDVIAKSAKIITAPYFRMRFICV